MINEWESEPDYVDWESHGLKCEIRRVEKFGHLCEYVSVPAGHPLYGKHYNNVEIAVHGGLTYSDNGKNDAWVFGFDCGHVGDLIPALDYIFRKMGNGTYKNIAYVRAECEKLAEALADV